MQQFPANPKNGTIFEVQQGLYYIYEAATRSWVRVAGGGQVFPLATPVQNGIMASDDLKKINRILVPMPSSTIKGENCPSRFVSGHINMTSGDDYIKITGTPTLQNTGVAANFPFRISQNTAGFDFTLDKNKLVQELITRGQINLDGPQGKQGKPGNTGDPGVCLPTGPKGPKGAKGSSPPCNLLIVPDTAAIEIKEGTNRAIVGLRTEQTSETEFAIIAQRGIVGNPDAAPSNVNVNCGSQSTWVVVVENNGGAAQTVYYVDMMAIMTSIQEKFEAEILRLKQGHEDVVQFWLEKMRQLFTSQKATICCAVTKCVSYNAQFGQTVSIAGVVNVSTSGQSFMGQIGAFTAIDSNGISGSIQSLESSEPPTPQAMSLIASLPKPLELVVDGALNAGTTREAARLDLPAGKYVIDLASCCIKTGDVYTANVMLIYNSGKPKGLIFGPSGAAITDAATAAILYSQHTVEIDHSGGVVDAYLPSPRTSQTSGAVTLRFTKKANVPAQPNIETPPILGCMVSQAKLDEYEAAWNSGKCCGMVMRIAGQDYIVMKRSLPGDPGCGGDENPEFDCVKRFTTHLGTPALAWPTFDGKTFLKLSKDNYFFKTDQDLQNLVDLNLRENKFTLSRSAVPLDDLGLPLAKEIWLGQQPLVVRQMTNVLFPSM